MALMDADCAMIQKPHEEEECPNISPCLSDKSWTVGPWLDVSSFLIIYEKDKVSFQY